MKVTQPDQDLLIEAENRRHMAKLIEIDKFCKKVEECITDKEYKGSTIFELDGNEYIGIAYMPGICYLQLKALKIDTIPSTPILRGEDI